jgi:hypothetical protein
LNYHNLSDREIVRKLALIDDRDNAEWKSLAKVLASRSLKSGSLKKLRGRVVKSEWNPAQTESDPIWAHGRPARDWNGNLMYQKTVLRPASETLYIEAAYGVLVRVNVAARTKDAVFVPGDPIVISGKLDDIEDATSYIPFNLRRPIEDRSSRMKEMPDCRGWIVRRLSKPRVHRKETDRLRAERFLMVNADSGYALGGLIRSGTRRKMPVRAMLRWLLGKGKLHLHCTIDPAQEIESRRRNGTAKPRTIRAATTMLTNAGDWMLRSYELRKGPPPKGDFANPWTAEESTQGLAKRGDWVTSAVDRRIAEGIQMVDIESLGLHVGLAASAWNHWIIGAQWNREATGFKKMCIRFDQAFAEGYPSIRVDVDHNEVVFYEGEERKFALSLSGTDEDRVRAHARETWGEKIGRSRVDLIVDDAWERGQKEIRRRFKEAGLMHLLGHVQSETA